jgi:hypothetical protein
MRCDIDLREELNKPIYCVVDEQTVQVHYSLPLPRAKRPAGANGDVGSDQPPGPATDFRLFRPCCLVHRIGKKNTVSEFL